MARLELVANWGIVVPDGFSRPVVDLVNRRFPGLGESLAWRVFHEGAPSSGDNVVQLVFPTVQMRVGGVLLDPFPSERAAVEGLEEQLKKHQGEILARFNPDTSAPAEAMIEVRRMVEAIYGGGRPLSCEFVWDGNREDAEGWFAQGYRIVYGGAKHEKGATVDEAVEKVRKAYVEFLELKLKGVCFR